jgi:hypothetical protein
MKQKLGAVEKKSVAALDVAEIRSGNGRTEVKNGGRIQQRYRMKQKLGAV